ncbi:protein kinase, partial [Sorangium cellulosum]
RDAASASSGRSLLGHVIGDKYGVTAIIGEGGMGAVYEAEHLQIGRLVAVKVMHPRETQQREAISRLEHEARVAGRIGHPNICEVYDMGWLPDGSPYLVMERLHGETLAQRIERWGSVPPSELVDIMLQVLSALVTAHERGIVHRDLKPENIFLSERAGMLPVAKLLDFGISQATGMDGTLDLTRTGMVMGTPYYMAPEQARGDVELDHRLDLWAVGVILYEALTGQRPFVARNYNALLVQILTLWHRPVTELDPTIPPGLSRLVDRALEKERDERFQSAREFQEALRRFKNQVPVSQKRRVERVAVQSLVEDRNDDGTMMFARLGGEQDAGEPGRIVAASGRSASEVARKGPQVADGGKGLPLRHGAWSTRASVAASDAGAVSRRSEPVAEVEVVDGPSRDDETEDRPTIPSLSPLGRGAELSDDNEATVVDPPPFPEDMPTVVRGEGRARGGDKS